MAYNYLDIVNEVLRSFNEVELTSSNFASTTGFYARVKDSVNAAIRDINHTHYEWPFNHVTQELTLTAGTIRYDFPANANTLDFDTFRIKENTTFNNRTIKLSSISYEDYLNRYIDHEYTAETNKRTIPDFVFQTTDLQFGVIPAPDQAYVLVYEYYSVPTGLDAYSDVPVIPERFRHVIVEGAMFYCYMFRGNEQSASVSRQRYEEGIKRMRSMLVNRYGYVRSGMITPASGSVRSFGDRVK